MIDKLATPPAPSNRHLNQTLRQADPEKLDGSVYDAYYPSNQERTVVHIPDESMYFLSVALKQVGC